MSDRMPRLAPEVVDLAWEAAQASNLAFDTLQEAKANITKVKEVARLAVAGITINGKAVRALERERNEAEINFGLLADMASVVMRQPADGDPNESPWSAVTIQAVRELEPVVVPEIDAQTAEKLEGLPADYRERVVARYAEKYEAVDIYIQRGLLPEAYRLPELSALVDRVIAVAPTFEHMQKKDWQPEVEFVPQGLSPAQWNDLFKTQELPGGVQMEGAYRGFSSETIDPINSEADASPWDVVVISEADRPVFTNVSKDGKNGSNAKKAVRVLSELPGVTDTSSPEMVIAQSSPREEAYNGMQLSRLERGQPPVDPQTWIISRENVEVDEVLRSVWLFFSPGDRQVVSSWVTLDGAFGSGGVRPSASGRDLVPKS